MSEMELTDVEEGGRPSGVGTGDLAAGLLSEVSAVQNPKRKRVGALEEEGTSECALVQRSTYPEMVRAIGRDLDAILQVEKDKRKLSAAAQRSILEIRARYEVLLDEALRQNVLLEGRVEEARRVRSCAGHEERTVVERAVTTVKTPEKTPAIKKKEKKIATQEKKKNEAKEVAFTEVTRKSKRKKKKKKKEQKTPKERASVVSAPAKAAKAIEKEKARAPARAFIVSVGEAGAGEAKRQLWADLVKGVAVPKLDFSAKLSRGDIMVKPADEATYMALKNMEAKGKGLKEETARWPTVLIYDVDRDISKEKLPEQVAEQNPELGLDKEAVVPLFMKGPKTDELVWWVCSVRPSAFKALVGKSLFIGLSRCRVKEYVDVVRCFKCQAYGHRAQRCLQKEDTCGRCAVKGHRAKDCKSVPVRCANCGTAAQSGHKGCLALHKATKSVARRTDFGSK